jgi:hypothetical protein
MKKILIFTLFLLVCYSCIENNTASNDDYSDFQVIIDEDLYVNAPADPLEILDIAIVSDSLKISFSSGGCDGSSWEVKLIDSGAILESFPVQRNLRLSLKNEELCKAIVFKEIAFDISKLKTDDSKIQLNVTNSNNSILYEY